MDTITRKRRGPAPGTGGRPPLPAAERLVHLPLRLKPDVAAALDEAATAAGASRSELARDLIERGLAARRRRKG